MKVARENDELMQKLKGLSYLCRGFNNLSLYFLFYEDAQTGYPVYKQDLRRVLTTLNEVEKMMPAIRRSTCECLELMSKGRRRRARHDSRFE